MTIAFIPGLLCGAFITIVATPGNRSRRFAFFMAALITAAATAATWFASNWPLVFQYLFSFGYGARAVEYGAEQSHFGWDAWEGALKAFSNGDVYLPHFLVILAGGLTTLALLGRTMMRDGIREAIRRVIASPLLPSCDLRRRGLARPGVLAAIRAAAHSSRRWCQRCWCCHAGHSSRSADVMATD